MTVQILSPFGEMKKTNNAPFNFRYALLGIGLIVVAWFICHRISSVEADELSLVIIKPDGVSKGLTSLIYRRLRDELGLELLMEKSFEQASFQILLKHYEEHKDRPFFAPLVQFMQSGPIAVSVWKGKTGTVNAMRELVGPTDPAKAPASSIRGEYGTSVQRNVIHASDSVESAKREIAIWFH